MDQGDDRATQGEKINYEFAALFLEENIGIIFVIFILYY
jgi:hypothetical protein